MVLDVFPGTIRHDLGAFVWTSAVETNGTVQP